LRILAYTLLERISFEAKIFQLQLFEDIIWPPGAAVDRVVCGEMCNYAHSRDVKDVLPIVLHVHHLRYKLVGVADIWYPMTDRTHLQLRNH
jgi:hypothetical protein